MYISGGGAKVVKSIVCGEGKWNKHGQGAKVVKSLNKIHEKGGILQEIDKRGEGNLCEEGGKI